MKTHWLYGRGPNKELDFKKEINKETQCGNCIHNKVCNHKMEDRCINIEPGNSRYNGCEGCTHHFTRWDKDPVPCFYCPDFHPIIKRPKKSKKK